MGPVAIIAGIGLAIGAAGTFMSVKAQKKQAKYAKRAADAQRSAQNMKAARERREAIRTARIQAATVSQGAVNEGVAGSSAALGGLGSIAQQLSSNLSFLDQYNTAMDTAGRMETRANVYAGKANVANSIGQFGMQVFSSASSLGSGFGGGGQAAANKGT